MNTVRIDAVEYRVRVVYDSLKRSFKVLDGPNTGTSIKARTIRDILGTAYGYSFQVEPDPRYPQDYDNFFDAISAPVDSHIVSLPYGQQRLEFEAMITSGSDTFGGTMGGFNRWRGLTVNFEPIEPQREQ